MKLTKSLIDNIQPPIGRDQAFYRDEQLKGFALRITASGVKSFVIEKLINGKVKRITLGRYGELTAEQARKEAQKLLGKIATGIDPVAEKQISKVKAITLHQVFQDYLTSHKELKPKTIYDYENILNTSFAEWKNKPLLFITKDKIAKHHTKLGEERGKACANVAMRVLRALFNFAASQYEDSQGKSLITENPVKRLSQTRAWYRVERRQTYVKPHELSAWYQGVMQLQSDILRDYFLLLIFTGLRREEAARLKWEQVDLKAKTLIILDTKNKQAHTLPLSDFIFELLQKRQQQADTLFVFPGTGKGGHLVESRKQKSKVIKSTGISFTIHDLRRTFITIAESLDISAYAVKRLVNHKMNSDATAGYIVSDVERLRKPMQLISENLVQLMGINIEGN